MAYDLVTWSPAVGGSGTDRYDLPAGSYVPAGSSSFSSTPTISEINSSSGINQIIGLINRRGKLFVSGWSDLTYVAAGDKITKTKYDSIKTKIGTLRTGEHFSTYTLPTVTTGTPFTANVISELRRSLGVFGVFSQELTASNSFWLERLDLPYNTLYSESLTGGNSTIIGKFEINASGIMYRNRVLNYIRIPDWFDNSFDTMKCEVFLVNGFSKTTMEAYAFELWTSDSVDVPINNTAYAYNLDNLESTSSSNVTNSTFDMAIDSGRVLAKAGSTLSIIWGTTHELAGTGSGAIGSIRGSGDVMDVNGSKITFICDFGSFP